MARSPATILQIIPRLDTGGAELSAIEITEAVIRAGGRMLVATEGGRMAPRITAAGGRIVEFPAGAKNPLRLLANARELARIVRSEGVALIHARSRAPAWSALRAARTTGIPFVTTYHGAYAEQNAAKRLYNSVMARGDVVIANSRYTADLIRSRYGTPEARIRVIHRGVDVARFDAGAVSAGRVRALTEAWGVAPGRRIILQAARLTGWKGQRVLIEALGELARRGRLDGAVAVLAGDAQGRDDYRDRLLAQAQALGLADSIILPGHVDDVPAAFKAAHAAVVASTEPEAFGRAAAEAEAMGCPVIATRLGAPQETILAAPAAPADAITGWLVPPGDAAALADALETALALAPAERDALGARAAAHVRRNFTVEAMQRATLAVYDGLLQTAFSEAWDRASGSGQKRGGTPSAS